MFYFFSDIERETTIKRNFPDPKNWVQQINYGKSYFNKHKTSGLDNLESE